MRLCGDDMKVTLKQLILELQGDIDSKKAYNLQTGGSVDNFHWVQVKLDLVIQEAKRNNCWR